MAIIQFQDENRTLEVECGTSLLEACIRAAVPVTFMCTIGTCRSCCVRVVDGLDNLSAADDDELSLLADMPQVRLACQAIVQGDVTLQTQNVIASQFWDIPEHKPSTNNDDA